MDHMDDLCRRVEALEHDGRRVQRAITLGFIRGTSPGFAGQASRGCTARGQPWTSVGRCGSSRYCGRFGRSESLLISSSAPKANASI
jgi:hypothetical protein